MPFSNQVDAPRLKDDKEHLTVPLPLPPLELQTTPKQVPKVCIVCIVVRVTETVRIECVCQVELRVLYESSEIAAEGYVDVEYELKGKSTELLHVTKVLLN